MKIIALSGKQGSGKTTTAKMLKEALQSKGVEVRMMKFADPLYDMQNAIQEILGRYGVGMKVPDGKLLQLLGTEWGRSTLSDTIWADILIERIKLVTGEKTVVIVDDTRFPNELVALQFLKAFTVRLEAGEGARKVRAEKWRDRTDHPSEIALDGYSFDLLADTEKHKAATVVNCILRMTGLQQ